MSVYQTTNNKEGTTKMNKKLLERGSLIGTLVGLEIVTSALGVYLAFAFMGRL